MNGGKDVGEPSKGKLSKFSEKLKENIQVDSILRNEGLNIY